MPSKAAARLPGEYTFLSEWRPDGRSFLTATTTLPGMTKSRFPWYRRTHRCNIAGPLFLAIKVVQAKPEGSLDGSLSEEELKRFVKVDGFWVALRLGQQW